MATNYRGELEQDDLYRIRHSAAHILAQAVLGLYPQARLGIGPPIADGFYYDFDLGKDENGRPVTFTPEDLQALEKRMRQIIAGRFPFECREVTADEARELFRDQPYKLELIEGLANGKAGDGATAVDVGGEVITTYRQDQFEDLCRGPHTEHTGMVRPDAFRLLSAASAYWRGNENNPSMQRIYGTAWRSKKELEAHLAALEAARERDHRKLGKELEIFTFDDEVGPGLPLWLPNGAAMTDELEKLAREVEFRAGYDRVRTPNLAKDELFLRSGHLPYYEDGMFPPMELEGVRYFMKPMNCPFHHKIFASKVRSYRDLPLRLTEYGTCYRYEKSGELMGLMRTRMLSMNDAHIYCSSEQFESEFLAVVQIYLDHFKLLGIDRYLMRFSTHSKEGLGKKYVDNEPLWEQTEEMVRRAMTNGGISFVEVPDEAAFYGPKIDVQVWSAIGREFTLATNQVDFAVPPRFDLKFTTAEGVQETPLCIHRAPLGTHERMVGFLIEHFGGKFPVWLSPEQVRVIPVIESANDYAGEMVAQLRDLGVRASADLGPHRMNAKIRSAQLMKVPYMAVVGEREVSERTVALRRRSGDQETLPLDGFVALLQDRIRTRSLEL